jgi:hypothetical protein
MSPSGAIAAAASGDGAMSCLGTGKNGPSDGATGLAEQASGSSAANRWSIPISGAPELRANINALTKTSIAGAASEDIADRIMTHRSRQVGIPDRYPKLDTGNWPGQGLSARLLPPDGEVFTIPPEEPFYTGKCSGHAVQGDGFWQFERRTPSSVAELVPGSPVHNRNAGVGAWRVWRLSSGVG